MCVNVSINLSDVYEDLPEDTLITVVDCHI